MQDVALRPGRFGNAQMFRLDPFGMGRDPRADLGQFQPPGLAPLH